MLSFAFINGHSQVNDQGPSIFLKWFLLFSTFSSKATGKPVLNNVDGLNNIVYIDLWQNHFHAKNSIAK